MRVVFHILLIFWNATIYSEDIVIMFLVLECRMRLIMTIERESFCLNSNRSYSYFFCGNIKQKLTSKKEYNTLIINIVLYYITYIVLLIFQHIAYVYKIKLFFFLIKTV